MVAVLAAALTFVIVFWTVVELGMPFIRWGWSHAEPIKESTARDGRGLGWSTVSTGAKAPVYHESRPTL
jgi:hypothetical protein